MKNSKMKSFSGLFYLVFICLFSCAKKDVDVAVGNNSFEIVELKPIETGIKPIGVPKIKVVNDLLFTLDLKDSVVFKVYNSEFQLLDWKYQLGQFPLELEFPIFSAPVVDGENERVNLLDLGRLNLVSFSPKIISDSIDWDMKANTLKNLEYFPKNIIYYSDSLNIYVPEIGGSLVLENKQAGSVEIVPYKFHLFDKIKPSNIPFVFQSVGALNRDKGIIAIAPILTGEVEFYDMTGSFIKSVAYDSTNHDAEMISQVDFSNTDILVNAIDIFSTSNYLYVLSSNNKVNQFLTGQKGSGSAIFKLDWNGSILTQYNLGVDASSFGVDESNNRFYVSLNEIDDNPIVYFEFE